MARHTESGSKRSGDSALKDGLLFLGFGLFTVVSGAAILWASLDLGEKIHFDTWYAMRRPIAAAVTEVLPQTGQQVLGAVVGVVFLMMGLLILAGALTEFWSGIRRRGGNIPAAERPAGSPPIHRRSRRQRKSRGDDQGPNP